MIARKRSLIGRVESVAAVACALEGYLWGGGVYGDSSVNMVQVATAVSSLLAQELTELITEVNDDHIVAVPARKAVRR